MAKNVDNVSNYNDYSSETISGYARENFSEGAIYNKLIEVYKTDEDIQ